MNQDQDKKKKKDNKPLEFSKIAPEKVFSRHLVELTITGKGFRKALANNIELEGFDLLEAEVISARKISLKVRVKPTTSFKWASVTIRDSSLEEPIVVKVVVMPDPISGYSQIPGGKFIFGKKGTAAQRELTLKPFAAAIFEVSCKDYMEFLNFISEHGDHSFCHPEEPKDKCHTPDFFDDAIRHHPSKPITGIDWYDAWAYANWRGFRLPSEEEWEKAVRGTDGYNYPWGEKTDIKAANTSDKSRATSYVSYFAQSQGQFGLYNGVGNVWEWTDSAGSNSASKIIRGGSFKTPLVQATTTAKSQVDRLTRRDDIGFRCVADITASVRDELENIWLEEETEKEKKAREAEAAKAAREAAKKDAEETAKKDKPKQQTNKSNAKIDAGKKTTAQPKAKEGKELTPQEKKKLERKKKRAEARKSGKTKKKKSEKK
jgi:hypothetical protein